MGDKQRMNWNTESVIQEIKKVMEVLKVDRMPTRNEMEQVLGNSSLTNKISKTGGFFYWANELGLETKESETSEGQYFERKAIDLIIDKGYSVNEMTTKHPYDLLINDKVKVDVKIANPYLLKGSRVHTFGINKKYATCDVYMLFAMNEDEDVERLLIIPSHKLKITTLSIGANSRYNKYIDRWDLVDKLTEFYSKLA